MRLNEINTRLAAIQTELETASGEQLRTLETEASNLIAERDQILADIQTRQQLRSNIAQGNTPGIVLVQHQDPTNTTRTFTADSVEYREAYLRNLQGREITAEQRAALTSAGAVIPTQTMNRIVGYFEDSPILSRVDLTHIPGYVSYPVEGNNADAAWVEMGTSATDSADTVTTLSLSAYKLIKTIEITADVSAMAIDAFEDWLVARLGNKMTKALDAAVINGTGSNQATGIAKTLATATGTYTKAKATYEDLIKIISSLGTEAAKNATFLMQRKLFYTDVIGIVDANNKPVVHQDPESPAKYNILGYSVILDDNVTKDDILFGDLFMYKLNLSKDPEITSDASVAFRSGSTVYRALALADGKLAKKDAFVRFNRSAS